MSATCKHCGAPREAGTVICPYCRTGYDERTLTQAIPCPKCKHLNPEDSQKCQRCQSWVVVQCVFCGALTAHNRPHCHRCGEAFHGSQERYRAMQHQHEQARRDARNERVAGTVGNAAAGFFGAMAGSMVAGAMSNPFDHGGYVEQHQQHPDYGSGFDHEYAQHEGDYQEEYDDGDLDEGEVDGGDFEGGDFDGGDFDGGDFF